MIKTSFLRERTRMYQGDFQDFSEFCVNAYLSTLDQSTSKKMVIGSGLPWLPATKTTKIDPECPKMLGNSLPVAIYGTCMLKRCIKITNIRVFTETRTNFLFKNPYINFHAP